MMMSRSSDDHSLVEACRAGRTEAFSLLVQRYQSRLYPTIARLVVSLGATKHPDGGIQPPPAAENPTYDLAFIDLLALFIIAAILSGKRYDQRARFRDDDGRTEGRAGERVE
jgi:hypothetical protein